MTQRLTHAERRQIKKEDVPWVGKPIAIDTIDRAFAANTRRMAAILRDTDAPRRASQAAEVAARLLDVTAQSHVKHPAACGRGCHYCCRTLVTATAPEIFRLARAVKARPDMTARIRTAAANAIPTTARHTARPPCPVLEAEICSLYEARPLACRSLLSQSLDACLRIFTQDAAESVPHVPPSMEIRATIILMLQAAMRLADLPYQQYELVQGLAAALSHDDAEARWLAGEPVFAGVETDQNQARAADVSAMVERLAASLAPTL